MIQKFDLPDEVVLHLKRYAGENSISTTKAVAEAIESLVVVGRTTDEMPHWDRRSWPRAVREHGVQLYLQWGPVAASRMLQDEGWEVPYPTVSWWAKQAGVRGQWTIRKRALAESLNREEQKRRREERALARRGARRAADEAELSRVSALFPSVDDPWHDLQVRLAGSLLADLLREESTEGKKGPRRPLDPYEGRRAFRRLFDIEEP